jgi:hypothetical protein
MGEPPMKPRFSLLVLMVAVGIISVAIGLMVLLVRSERMLQIEAMKQRTMAEQARAEAMRAEVLARQLAGQQPVGDTDASAVPGESPASSLATGAAEIERLRRENAALRARVEELERAAKVNRDPQAPPGAACVP